MLKLLLILLFPISAVAQMMGGAYYDGVTKMQTGVLIAGSTLSVSQKATLAYDSLHCKTVRINVVLSTYNGTLNAYDTYNAKGLTVVANVSYYTTGSLKPTLDPSLLSDFTAKLTQYVNDYHPAYVVVENEELTKSYFYGPLINYVNEVAAAYAVCHPRGILVINGGVGGINSGVDVAVYRWLKTFNTAAATDYGTHMSTGSLNAANNPGSNDTYEAYLRQLDTLEGVKPYIDRFCRHTKEVLDNTGSDHSAVTIITGHQLQYQADYLRSRYNKLLVDNEGGSDNDQPALVAASMKEYMRCGFVLVQWWSGTGPGAEPLHDDATATINANGVAYKAFNDYIK